MTTWTPEETVRAVHRALSVGFDHRDRLDSVRTSGEDIEVRLRGIPSPSDLGAVHFSMRHQPFGSSTGERCSSVDEWAEEVRLDLEEAIATREILAAERRVTAGGAVLLRWWGGDGWSR